MTQRAAAADQADAESLRPIPAESSLPSRHLGTVPKCRLGTIFEDPPKAPVQKMANMSTVTVIVTFTLSTKDLFGGTYSHQGLLLLNI